MKEHDFREDTPLTPRKAMREKCLDCCAGSAYEVRICPIPSCTLWPFRMGRGICTDPKGAVQTTDRSEAQKKAARQAGKRLAARAQN